MTSNIVFSEKKQKDMEWAKGIVSRIEADRRKFVKYKDSRPITDIKHMIETSAELYGDNTAFYQKYKGDETFTAISYRQMIEKVNGLGTALIHHGLQGKRIAVIGETAVSGRSLIWRSSAERGSLSLWTRNFQRKN